MFLTNSTTKSPPNVEMTSQHNSWTLYILFLSPPRRLLICKISNLFFKIYSFYNIDMPLSFIWEAPMTLLNVSFCLLTSVRFFYLLIFGIDAGIPEMSANSLFLTRFYMKELCQLVYKCYSCLLQDVLLWLQRGQTGGQSITIIHLLSIGGLSSSRVSPPNLRLWPKFITNVSAREHLSLLYGIKVRLDPYPVPIQQWSNRTDIFLRILKAPLLFSQHPYPQHV